MPASHQATRTSPLLEGRALPLLVEPSGEVDPAAWAAEHRGSIDAMLLRHAAVLLRDFDLRTVGPRKIVVAMGDMYERSSLS